MRGVQVRLHLLLPAQIRFCRVCTVRVGWCVVAPIQAPGGPAGLSVAKAFWETL